VVLFDGATKCCYANLRLTVRVLSWYNRKLSFTCFVAHSA